jgi:hypothetical protein
MNIDLVSLSDLPGWFDSLSCDPDFTRFTSIGRQTSCLEKTNSPKPFIYPHSSFHILLLPEINFDRYAGKIEFFPQSVF